MDWLYFAAASAVVLGVYDVCKKAAVVHNAVLPTLWASSVVSWCFVLPLGALSLVDGAGSLPLGLGVGALPIREHVGVLLKAVMVSLSWLLTFSAVKHLPISLAGPIRSTAPLFTLLGAVLLFAEQPTLTQWCGMLIILGGYVAFAIIGQADGLRLRANPWIWMLLGGTLLGAGSGLYDKLLLQRMKLEPMTLQFWFSTYNVLLQTLLVAAVWWPRRAFQRFQWRATMFWVGALLVLADQLYFRALAGADALVSVVSLVRRSNVVVSFSLGGWLFSERLLVRKAIGLALILVGLFVLRP